ncbi:hypothetical protein evm_012429 [Chilo suppressalis]|nr:hypothetical protein evm_012429 [Chilo suppressalis]
MRPSTYCLVLAAADAARTNYLSCLPQYGGAENHLEIITFLAFHLMTGHFETENNHCNITGLACLHSNKSVLTDLKPPWRKRPGLVCDCMPSCNDIEITIIRELQEKSNIGKKEISNIEIELAHLPSERYKRSVVRSHLDLVGKYPTFLQRSGK